MICFTLDNIHVSKLFSRNIPPSPSPTESKRLFYTSVPKVEFKSQWLADHAAGARTPFPRRSWGTGWRLRLTTRVGLGRCWNEAGIPPCSLSREKPGRLCELRLNGAGGRPLCQVILIENHPLGGPLVRCFLIESPHLQDGCLSMWSTSLDGRDFENGMNCIYSGEIEPAPCSSYCEADVRHLSVPGSRVQPKFQNQVPLVERLRRKCRAGLWWLWMGHYNRLSALSFQARDSVPWLRVGECSHSFLPPRDSRSCLWLDLNQKHQS